VVWPRVLYAAAENPDDVRMRWIALAQAWAAGGANRMPALASAVPDYIESVTILVDNNDAGRHGSHELARRLHARGVEVLLLPSGGGVDEP
jgi:hypothetical protein